MSTMFHLSVDKFSGNVGGAFAKHMILGGLNILHPHSYFVLVINPSEMASNALYDTEPPAFLGISNSITLH